MSDTYVHLKVRCPGRHTPTRPRLRRPSVPSLQTYGCNPESFQRGFEVIYTCTAVIFMACLVGETYDQADAGTMSVGSTPDAGTS